MRQQMRTGIGFYLLILVIIAAAVYVSGTLDKRHTILSISLRIWRMEMSHPWQSCPMRRCLPER